MRRNPLENRGPPLRTKTYSRPTDLFQFRPLEEYSQAWQLALVSLENDIQKLAQYQLLGVPGLDLEKLNLLRDQLNKIGKQNDDST
jgi:hypothetical protein